MPTVVTIGISSQSPLPLSVVAGAGAGAAAAAAIAITAVALVAQLDGSIYIYNLYICMYIQLSSVVIYFTVYSFMQLNQKLYSNTTKTKIQEKNKKKNTICWSNEQKVSCGAPNRGFDELCVADLSSFTSIQ